MSEESLETGGRSARKAVEEAGFSDELKRELEEKIANASFRSEHAGAFAEANMPLGAGRGTRDIAAATPWTGTESVEDAALRMLTDAYKPIRVPSKIPGLRGPPTRIDTGRPKKQAATGARLVNARDKTSIYASMKDSGMSEQERERLRQEMKQRFQPDGRAPATVQGLANLANQRIEDAIARGLFKNLPRGKKIERDYNASSPFIDTTEYFMNKIIQKQEIVPPWIEKQQELVSVATKFRGRLRADWRRHVARTLASKGGGLERQMKLADQYALAESRSNPSKKAVEQINTMNSEGQLSQITLAGELKATPTSGSSPAETVIKVIEQTVGEDGALKQPEEQTTLSAEQPAASAANQEPAGEPTVPPFRDPQWEQTERAYLRAAVDNINSMTRSYNLMAPDLAKKPYFSLDRELRACFADVAPTVASAIRERALAPKIKGVEIIGHKPGGVLERFSMERTAHVHDERKPQYGFKDFWRDLFASKP
ncbi:hypothetical protein LTR36_006014 [Oleoguttula mirabilis]|uniref:DnaJ homologue subfamily C member 28 conserved domain-containing protein n=1 Tax=Oleoguttula mirabilis TaxID=1507867 RepID=A0AAV9JCN9_9PEZI|nr:hypothetical protein LTR36_006014 [Oleoguttula mirabilis]